jgi:hypothetical protein
MHSIPFHLVLFSSNILSASAAINLQSAINFLDSKNRYCKTKEQNKNYIMPPCETNLKEKKLRKMNEKAENTTQKPKNKP